VRPRHLIAALVVVAILFTVPTVIASGCESDDDPSGEIGGGAERRPVLGRSGTDDEAPRSLGYPAFATKNTTRVGGADAIADAAAVALATYPARTPETRPQAVSLVDADNWQAAISAAQLMSRPLGAPVLFASGDTVPAATEDALSDLQPRGARDADGAKVIRIGTPARAEGYADTNLEGDSPAALARAIDRLHTTLAGRPSDAVVVASSDAPEYAMPAAAWAAKAGSPVLWSTQDELPGPTRAAIVAHRRPRIYVLGPPDVIGEPVMKDLEKLGTVRRISASDPVRAAITFARYSDGAFGWNVVDPGHGLVFASTSRPTDAAAAAPLSAAGKYGPLLLLPDAATLPASVREYLLDIQPGYDRDPVRGLYNHGWLMGDESAISLDVQAQIDAVLEIQPVTSPSS
jgi:putative cell wall-binding protein